jgi:hypothetical protein
VSSSLARLLPAAALGLVACYAELPGSAPIDDFSNGSFPEAGFPPNLGGGLPGGDPIGGGMGGDLDTGMSGPLDAGGDVGLVTSCDGSPVGTLQMRTLYAEAQVVPPMTCKGEVQSRVCRNTGWSAWSGSYKAESCMEAAVRSCGDVAHGASETRERYAQAVVSEYTSCVPEEQIRDCDDGTFSAWSGSYTVEKCEVGFLGRCNVLSDFGCVATTACTFKVAGSQCLGTTSHSCSANAECQSGVCVGGSCVAAKMPVTGACDEAADCAACSNSIAAVCSATNQCVCGNGATCSNNSHCQGTCVASRCVAPNSTCDNDDDCTIASHKCVRPALSSSGTCLLRNGQTCSTNAQCEHVCRPLDGNEQFTQKACAARGTSGDHCDENADCVSSQSLQLVCRTASGEAGPHCWSPLPALAACEETADCDQSTPTVCMPLAALGSAKYCIPSSGTQGGGGNSGGPGGGGDGD